jgi:hypothetical protein
MHAYSVPADPIWVRDSANVRGLSVASGAGVLVSAQDYRDLTTHRIVFRIVAGYDAIAGNIRSQWNRDSNQGRRLFYRRLSGRRRHSMNVKVLVHRQGLGIPRSDWDVRRRAPIQPPFGVSTHRSGMVNRNVVPWPTTLSTVIVPPCASTS